MNSRVAIALCAACLVPACPPSERRNSSTSVAAIAESTQPTKKLSASDTRLASQQPDRETAPVGSQSDTSTARAAMDTFLRALRDKDKDLLLSCFSRTHPFYLTSTEERSPKRAAFTYRALERGLNPGGDFIGFMFGGDHADDSLAAFAVEGQAPLTWVATSPTRFVPATQASPAGEKAIVSIKWTKHGGRFVVDEIATPF